MKKKISPRNNINRPQSSQSNLLSNEKALEKSFFLIFNSFLSRFEELNRKNNNSYKKLDFNLLVAPLRSDLILQIDEKLNLILNTTKNIDQLIEKYIQIFKSFHKMNKISNELAQFLDKINAEIIRNLNNKKLVDPRGKKISKERSSNSVNLFKRSESSENAKYCQTPTSKEKKLFHDNFRVMAQSMVVKKEEGKQEGVLYSLKKEGKEKIIDELNDLDKEINEMIEENNILKISQVQVPKNLKMNQKVAAGRKGTTLAQRSQDFLKRKETKEEFMKV